MKILIPGHREIFPRVVGEIIKRYINRGDIIWGILKNNYISGFENQPQYKAFRREVLDSTLGKLSKFKFKNSLQIFEHSQEELEALIYQLRPDKVIFVTGSWQRVLHKRPEFKPIHEFKIPYSFRSPFLNETEARRFYEETKLLIYQNIAKEINDIKQYHEKNDTLFLKIANLVKKKSFDYTWQTGAILTQNNKVISMGHNCVMPYETKLFHEGSKKERLLSETNDLNNNETNHAEMECILNAINLGYNLNDTTLYTTLMPCPICARFIAKTKIKKVVYQGEHYGGLSEQILQEYGKELFKHANPE